MNLSVGRGLGNLKRRAEAVGGKIEFTSGPGGILAEMVFPLSVSEIDH